MFEVTFKNGTVKEFETLVNADLRKADFMGSDLSTVDLTNANLAQACLFDCNLTGAILL